MPKAVAFEEVRDCYKTEHDRTEGFDVGLDYLEAANNICGGKWTLMLLSSRDIPNVMVPAHNHDIDVVPKGQLLSVSAALQRLQQLPKEKTLKCWDRINAQQNRDYTKSHICLKWENGVLHHVDGFHRMLAYVLFEKAEIVSAFVAGDRKAV
ncbi:MAG TPA: DUF6309 family protein [Terriglobales bacterium]|jgi:hypothetical protein|nr:DUF6309 family protein [Terriglobales bacterium]